MYKNRLLNEWQELKVELKTIDEVKNINILETSVEKTKEVNKDTEIFLIKRIKKTKIHC